jgi:hypothetical protein
MINSQVFRLVDGNMVRFRYLNQSLVFGVNLKKDAEATPTQICAALNPMYEKLPWSRCTIPLALNRFNLVQKFGFQPEWFLPVHLGGYGLKLEFGPHPTGHGLTLTKQQRVVASAFVNNPDLALIRTMGSDRSWKNYTKLSMLRKAFPNWRLIPKGFAEVVNDEDYDHETFSRYSVRVHDLNSSEQFRWVARYNEFSKAAHLHLNDIGSNTFFKAMKVAKFHKPMSNHKIRKFLEVDFWATPGPACPPKWPHSAERCLIRSFDRLVNREYGFESLLPSE